MQLCNHLSRSPLHKLSQIRLCRNTQHELARNVRNHGEILLSPLLPVRTSLTLKELLQLLQRRLHRDNLVCTLLAVESLHGSRNRVGLLDSALLEQLL